MRPYKVAYEHPTQLLASTFLRALALDDHAVVWERLSRESRGLLEGSRQAEQASFRSRGRIGVEILSHGVG